MSNTDPLLSELRRIAGTLTDEASRLKASPAVLDRLAGDLAVVAEELRGQTLITLPAPDETDPDRWFRNAGNVEIDPDGCEPDAVWLRDLAHDPEDARELALALLAAADRATAGQPTRELGIQAGPVDHDCPAHGTHPHKGMRCLDCPACMETAGLPPERHSPDPTGDGDGKDTPDHANDAHRAAETYDLEVLCEALRATGIKVEDVNPRHLREALVETSGPPWGQGRGAYLAGLLGKQFAEDKRQELASETPETADPHALCHACGRPRYPEHDADAPGPTVRHPFKPSPHGYAPDAAQRIADLPDTSGTFTEEASS